MKWKTFLIFNRLNISDVNTKFILFYHSQPMLKHNNYSLSCISYILLSINIDLGIFLKIILHMFSLLLK